MQRGSSCKILLCANTLNLKFENVSKRNGEIFVSKRNGEKELGVIRIKEEGGKRVRGDWERTTLGCKEEALAKYYYVKIL